MADPVPFLSTIAGSSAAMVAIVGGLLVARFVTLISEQEGAQHLLDDAKERLTTARRREEEARDKLYRWDVDDFFETKVLRAIADGTRDLGELRDISGSGRLSDEELARVVEEVATEFESARRTLKELVPDDAQPDGDTGWENFKRKTPGLPQTDWDEVWNIAYIDLLIPPQPRVHSGSLFSNFATYAPLISISPVPEYVALREQRRDALRTSWERGQQQAQDIESEVVRLQRARDAIIRPKGLGWGLVVLSVFTVVGIIIPVWLMSRAPKRLTAHFGEVVFGLFLVGLLALFIYMSTLALRLSGWRRKRSTPGQDRQ